MSDAPRLGPGLSAPEVHLLINMPRWDAPLALKVGFMGLVAQGILRLEIEERPGIFRTRRVPHLRVAPVLPSPLPPVAASLISMVRAAEPDGDLKTVLRHCHIDYHQTLSGFIKDCIGPALVARGLAVSERARALGIFPYNRFVCTPVGQTERARLLGLMHEAKTVPAILESDPAKAAALIAALGSAFLLVEELKPHYPELEKAMRKYDSSGSGGDGGGYYFPDGETSGIGDGDFCFDFGHLDFACFDSGAFDSFDAGFSDGGGGDGGGGDGGGGGC
jgi:hypothetical protein